MSGSTICSPAGQIATTAATWRLTAPAWIASSPPMLEPRSAMRRSSTSGRSRKVSDDALNVGDHARAHVALAVSVPAIVEGESGKALAHGRTREVGVVLLARARTVEDHDPGAGSSEKGRKTLYAMPSSAA